jgi:hypothetical protein
MHSKVVDCRNVHNCRTRRPRGAARLVTGEVDG